MNIFQAEDAIAIQFPSLPFAEIRAALKEEIDALREKQIRQQITGVTESDLVQTVKNRLVDWLLNSHGERVDILDTDSMAAFVARSSRARVWAVLRSKQLYKQKNRLAVA